MKKSGYILFLVLLCVAFLVSCGKRTTEETKMGELVRAEAVGDFPGSFRYNTIGEIIMGNFV